MTDKEKAKAYDEALERARELYNGSASSPGRKEWLEKVFPELRESEDERVRNRLITLVDILDKTFFSGANPSKEQCFDYLEKLKEPIDPFDTKLFQDGVKEGRRLEREDMEKEQKPADNEARAIAYREYERGRESGLRDGQKYVLDNAESYGLCKPAKWSEDIIRKGVQEVGLTQHQIDWFKKNVFPLVKQEWSEEDEEMYARVVRRYTDYEGVIMRTKEESVANKILDVMAQEEIWLKTRRPSWKPSEEHFQGLRRAITKAENGSDAWNSLTDLYEHLKKL